jgi:hypothetical protein
LCGETVFAMQGKNDGTQMASVEALGCIIECESAITPNGWHILLRLALHILDDIQLPGVCDSYSHIAFIFL